MSGPKVAPKLRQLTVLLHILLVAFTSSDLIFQFLAFFNGLFNGNDPAVTLL